jgi:hypothetical protein
MPARLVARTKLATTRALRLLFLARGFGQHSAFWPNSTEASFYLGDESTFKAQKW